MYPWHGAESCTRTTLSRPNLFPSRAGELSSRWRYTELCWPLSQHRWNAAAFHSRHSPRHQKHHTGRIFCMEYQRNLTWVNSNDVRVMSVNHGINDELLLVNEDNYFWSSFMLQMWEKLGAFFYVDSLGFGCQKVSPSPYVRLHVKIQFDCPRHCGDRHWSILLDIIGVDELTVIDLFKPARNLGVRFASLLSAWCFCSVFLLSLKALKTSYTVEKGSFVSLTISATEWPVRESKMIADRLACSMRIRRQIELLNVNN